MIILITSFALCVCLLGVYHITGSNAALYSSIVLMGLIATVQI